MQVLKVMMLTVLFAALNVIATVLCLVPAAAIPVVLFDRGC